MAVSCNTGWNFDNRNPAAYCRRRISGLMVSGKTYCYAAVLIIWLLVLPDFPGYADALSHSVPDGKTISGISIEITGAAGNPAPWKRIAENMVTVKTGSAFSSREMANSVSVLESGSLFTVEKSKAEIRDNSVVVHFQLQIVPRIQDIRITGSFPVFEREILNAMTVYTGDAYRQEKILRQQALIESLMRAQGFIAPEVRVHAHQDMDSGNYTLHVDISKGAFMRVDHFALTGNKSFSDLRLKMRLETWKSSLLPGSMNRFRKAELDEDIKNLLLFYRNHHYPEVRIDPEVVADEATGRARIILNISEGPYYRIRFQGNEQFWDWTLLDDLQLSQAKAGSMFWVRKSTRVIRERYVKKGYADCRIQVQNDPDADLNGEHRLEFRIEEGKQSVVRSLGIQGNQSLSEELIQDQIITQTTGLLTAGAFNRNVLDDDIRGIVALYLKNGYPDVQVEENAVWEVSEEENRKYGDIVLQIQEGVKVTVAGIRFDGLPGLTREWALKTIVMKPGDPFRAYMIQNDSNLLAMHISELGYPHVKVHDEHHVDMQTRQATITYKIEPGPYVRNGDIVMVGNFKTRPGVIRKEFPLKTGNAFAMKEMIAGQRNIQNINALKAARVKPVGLQEKADTIDFLVEVEEKKPYAIEASIGYDTTRRLYISTRLSDLNLLGLNKEVWAELEGSQIGSRGELGITEPRLLNTRISASGNLFWEKQEERNVSFGTRSYGLATSFVRKLPFQLSANLGVRYERKEQYLRDESDIEYDTEELYDPRGIIVVSPSLVYNSVDSFIRPREGVYASVGIDFSRGLENSLDNFIIYRGEVRWYTMLHKRIVLAVRGRAGHIVPSGEESVIPEDQLFFLGGLSSVRGYGENRLRIDAEGDALGGRTEIVGSAELRFDIGFNLELAPFYDIGSVRNALVDEGRDDFLASAGLSLRYLTPYLPIGVQYGYKLDEQETDTHSGRFYFSLGYTF